MQSDRERRRQAKGEIVTDAVVLVAARAHETEKTQFSLFSFTRYVGLPLLAANGAVQLGPRAV